MVARSPRGWPGTPAVAACRSAVATALGGMLQQLDTDPGPHETGEAAAPGEGDEVVAPDDTVTPAETPAAMAAARAGRGLMIEQDRAQGIDRPRGTTEPLQLGEPLPHRVDEPTLDGRTPFQPFHGPGQQSEIGSRWVSRHDGLTPASHGNRPGRPAPDQTGNQPCPESEPGHRTRHRPCPHRPAHPGVRRWSPGRQCREIDASCSQSENAERRCRSGYTDCPTPRPGAWHGGRG